MRPRSEEYRTSPVLTDERQAEGALAEAPEPTQEDIKTLQFVLHQRNAESYLTDEARGLRDNPNVWNRVDAAIKGSGMEPHELDQFAKDVGWLATSSKHEITSNFHLNQASETHPQLAYAADIAKEQVDYQAARLILQHSGLYPPPPLAEEGSEKQQLWMAAVNERIQELAVSGRHGEIPEFLREAKSDQERYHATGIEPEGHLDLARYQERQQEGLVEHQQEAKTDHQPGFNPVHTTAFNTEGTAQEAVQYVRQRMSEMMDDQKATQVEPTAFAKAFVEPYMDDRLSASFSHYDMPDVAYVTTNVYQQDQKSLLHGATDDPQVHLEATYNRVMRNAISKTGMAEAASRHDAAEFTIAAIKTSHLANDMKEWLDNAANHWSTDPQAARMDPAGYEPVLEWQDSKQSHWRHVDTETNGFTDPTPLLERAERMERMIMGPMSDVYTTAETGTPYTKTLTEAMRDIADARHALGTIIHEADMDRKQTEATEYLAANADFTVENPSVGVQQFARDYLDAINQREMQKERDMELFQERGEELRLELNQAGFNPEETARLTEGLGAKTMALYDRSIQLLSHADFNLSYIHHNRQAA